MAQQARITQDQPAQQPARRRLIDVPTEVLLEHLLPALAVRDLLSLSCADKQLHRLCNDEKTWARLCHRDYPSAAYLPELLAARLIPNKKFYAGLRHSRVFVWGLTDHGRLGIDLNPPLGGRAWRYRRYIASPQELEINGKAGRTWHQGLLDALSRAASGSEGRDADDQASRPALQPLSKADLGSVVSLVTGLTSFAALTSTGKVIVWGQLNGDRYGIREEDWGSKYTPVPEPTVLPLPFKAVDIVLDCSHLTVLDEDNIVWDLPSFGKAYHHESPLMCAPATPGNRSSPPYIAKIANGQAESACLTADGKIIEWSINDLGAGIDAPDMTRTDSPYAQELRQLQWGKVNTKEHELPPLPTRQEAEWPDDSDGHDRRRDEEKWNARGKVSDAAPSASGERVVQIEYWVSSLVARKANGEVWVWEYDHWSYVPGISRPDLIDLGTRDTHDVSNLKLASCTRTTVWETNERSEYQSSNPIDGFGDASLIRVERSGSHYLALTQRGELFAWGDRNDAGELGLGTTDNVKVPTRVTFGDDKGMAIVLDMSAGSEHSGAIVLGDIDVGSVRGEDSASDVCVPGMNYGAEEIVTSSPLRLRGGGSDPDDASGSIIQERRDQPWVEHPTGPNRPDEARAGPAATGAGGTNQPGASALRGDSTETPLAEPSGEQSRQSAGQIGNHPTPSAALRAPAFRIGFAGRHALQQGQRAAGDDGQEAWTGVGNHPQAGPGGALFRVGFAGRGRGRPQ